MPTNKKSQTNKPSRPVTEKKSNIVDIKEPRAARPATSPEAREKQLIDLAVNLAEKQLRDGTASAAVIQHYLKMASKREVLEREILEKQSTLIEAKASSITKGKESDDIAKQAIEAMKSYRSSGN